MTIRFACANCGQKLSVPDEKAGVSARCPKCKQQLLIPPASPAPLAPEPTSATVVPPAALKPVADVQAPRPATSPPSSKPVFPRTPPIVTAPSPPMTAPPPVTPSPGVTRPTAAAATTSVPTGAPRISPTTTPNSPPPSVTPRAPAPPPLPVAQPLPEALPAEEVPADIAWMYDDAPSSTPTVVRPLDARSSASPWSGRLVVTQGLLLIVMLAAGFGLGRVSQRGSGPAADNSVARSVTLSGRVMYGTSGATTFADEGAVVLVLPAGQKPSPDERLAYEGLRPADLPLDPQHETLEKLRLLGGGMARVDSTGQFRISLPRSGPYYVLVISQHGARRANVAPNKGDLAQLGRFVNMASELIGDRRYRWSAEDISGNRRLDTSLPY